MSIILITGGATGIGKELTKKFLSNGNTVIIVSRTKSNIESTYLEFADIGGTLYPQFGDLTSIDYCSSLKKEIEKIGSINCLINCAGVQGEISPFYDSKIQDWYAGFNNNVYSVINSVKLVLPYMIRKNFGKIINFSGGGATGSRPNFSSYAASKIAIVRFSEIIADELYNYNIDVNMISPGACNTRMMDEIINAKNKAGENEVKSALSVKNTGGTPISKVFELVNFLCSKDSNKITGKIISAVWDDWKNPQFQQKLRLEKDFATLRRIDGRNFVNL